MSWTTGTATNHKDLLNKLHDYLISDPLVTAGEDWEVLNYVVDDELRVRGKGNAGLDNIYVNFKLFNNSGIDLYNLLACGATGHNIGLNWDSQQTTSFEKALTLSSSPIKYWFFITARRIIIAAKVSGALMAGYYGFGLPYGAPSTYPYPMFIGGNLGSYLGKTRTINYASVTQDMGNFWCPAINAGLYDQLGITISKLSSASFLSPSGQWVGLYNIDNAGVNPTMANGNEHKVIPNGLLSTRENIDGTYSLYQAEVLCKGVFNGLYMALDGVNIVSGFGNSSENIITVDGVDYLVVQNVFRVGTGDFAAIRMD